MNSVVDYNIKQIIDVRADKPYTLFVKKHDGKEIELDLTTLVETREAFWRLKNFRYFRNVAIDPLGGLYWSEGEDISPTKIFHYAKN